MKHMSALIAVFLVAAGGWGQEDHPNAPLGSMSLFVGGLNLDLSPLNELLEPAGYPPLSGWGFLLGTADLTPYGNGLLAGTLSLAGFAEAQKADRKTALELSFFGLMGGTEFGEGGTNVGLLLAVGGGLLQFTFRERRASDIPDALTPTMSRPLLLFLGALPYLTLSGQLTDWLRLELGLGWLVSLPGWWFDDWRALSGPRLAPGGLLLAAGVVFDWAAMVEESPPGGSP